MAIQTPVVVGTNRHTPLVAGDTLPGSAVQISGDAGNALSAGSDGGLYAPPSRTLIANVAAAAAIALDLAPLSAAYSEILFNITGSFAATSIVSFANAPPAGVLAEFVVVVAGGASASLVWPASVHWPFGIAPGLTQTTGKQDTYVFYTQDGGQNYYGFTAAQNQ